ncbi:MAG: nitrite reductase large subunit NirB, partial [Cellvibrionaceae bacterium]|nr:nitrite reductase large subunit NirB [Cellvibrionaceae bacterium]
MNHNKVLVVGNGMVGHHFVESLIEAEPEAKLTVLSGESRLAYDRVHLSEFFGGKSADDLALTTAEHYRQMGVEFYTEQKVVAIDRAAKCVSSASGAQYHYDKLVLATGSYPFVPPIAGGDQPHCLVYRTIDDLEAIAASAAVSKVGVVVGGGLLGLEAANALKQLGLATHVVEFAPQLMAMQLDPVGGDLLKSKIEQLGVAVHTTKATEKIIAGEQCRYRMCFADGDHLETDLILFSAGIRPHDELARACELAVGERGGIMIDNYCQTSDPDIYAIGECALWDQRIFGLVAPGYQMAKVVAKVLLDSNSEMQFEGADMSTKLKLLGVDVGSIGDAHGKTPAALSYSYENQPEGIYKKIVVSADGKQLLGAVLVGDCAEYDTLLQYSLNNIELPEAPEALILPMADAAPGLGVEALPDSASICSCHNVSKGDVVAAIDDGACDLAAVKSCTKASTGCGGCSALLKNLVDTTLAQRGLEVNTDLCEHFAYNRQELFDIIRVEQIKTFAELLGRHGQGLGCDICKPTVGSILASLWNDYVLEPDHVPLQDTNDTYLANMQKDGSYSVVPRIAGGEITPDKLIVIGQLAKKYDLYTKITGGQRIDLFGARLEQLP